MTKYNEKEKKHKIRLFSTLKHKKCLAKQNSHVTKSLHFFYTENENQFQWTVYIHSRQKFSVAKKTFQPKKERHGRLYHNIKMKDARRKEVINKVGTDSHNLMSFTKNRCFAIYKANSNTKKQIEECIVIFQLVYIKTDHCSRKSDIASKTFKTIILNALYKGIFYCFFKNRVYLMKTIK